MVAYVFAGLGIARLFWRGVLGNDDQHQVQPNGAATWGGWIAALVLLLNPNLIYMQATAMTESRGTSTAKVYCFTLAQTALSAPLRQIANQTNGAYHDMGSMSILREEMPPA